MKIDDRVEFDFGGAVRKGFIAADMASTIETANWIVVLDQKIDRPGSAYHEHKAMIVNERLLRLEKALQENNDGSR